MEFNSGFKGLKVKVFNSFGFSSFSHLNPSPILPLLGVAAGYTKWTSCSPFLTCKCETESSIIVSSFKYVATSAVMITDRRDKHESQPDLNFGFAVLYNENSSTVVSQSYVMNIRKYVYEE